MFDALDRAILAHLQEDARRSHRHIAAAVESTQPTVTARIRRMEDAGLILGYTVRLDAAAPADLTGTLSVLCHWCKQRTDRPVWWHDAKAHPFCCNTCKAAYVDKHQRLGKGL